MVSPTEAERLLESSRPRGRLTGVRLPAYIGLGLLLGVLLADPGVLHLSETAAYVALLVAAIWVGVAARWTLRRQVRTIRRWTQAGEAVQLEQWQVAHEALRGLLARPAPNTVLRAQGLLGLAAVADHFHDYATSQLLYHHVSGQRDIQAVQRQAATLGLAVAMLRNEELTDAVRLIDRLARQDLPAPWTAHLEMVRLIREVVMGQSEDVVAAAVSRQQLFRQWLSARSGFGYALMAVGFHRLNRTDRAADLWADATLLIRPEKLLDRFPMLEELTRQYPACEVPL